MTVSVTSAEAHEAPATSGFWALTLGSIGVVFGDIGTSPLYAFREAVAGAAQGQPVTRVVVLGVLSLILWALFIVVTAKYVLLLLRADNNGEGGTLSLMALGQRALGRRSWPLLALGVIGASMFIGDSMITPMNIEAPITPSASSGQLRRPSARCPSAIRDNVPPSPLL